MPAQNVQDKDQNNDYFHIYNKGVEKRNLFNDSEDYEVFLSYLKDYLTTPPDPEKNKKTFSVNGRTFQGVPHLPKNYFNKVELIAYSLLPDHFHLLVNQKTLGSLEKLIRSLCTRYAIYYNKKYNRSGSLFIGPYKSAQIKDVSQLLHLTRHIHHESLNGHSSYEEYLGVRANQWVKPDVVLAYFEKSENDYFKGINGYKNFVESYVLKPDEAEMLEKIIFESMPERLEKRDLKPKDIESFKEVLAEPVPEHRSKTPHFMAASAAIFVLLFALGVRNVNISVARTNNSIASLPSPTPQVSGIEDEKVESRKVLVIIKISDGAESVNIRERPTTKSEIVAKAYDGDTFEFVSKEGEWYQIKLDDGSGFVSERYAQMKEEEI